MIYVVLVIPGVAFASYYVQSMAHEWVMSDDEDEEEDEG